MNKTGLRLRDKRHSLYVQFGYIRSQGRLLAKLAPVVRCQVAEGAAAQGNANMRIQGMPNTLQNI